jgi:hypothetical protein
MARRERSHCCFVFNSPRLKFDHRLVLTNLMLDLFSVAMMAYCITHGWRF